MESAGDGRGDPERLPCRPHVSTPDRARPLRRMLLASVLTGLAGQAALVVSGVLVARMLGVVDRGELALLAVIPTIIAQFGGLGLPLATTFEIARRPAIARPLLRRLSGFIALQAAVLTLLHAALLLLLVGGRDDDVQRAAAFTIVVVPGSLVLQHGLAVLQGQRRYMAFNALRLAPVVCYATLALALFVGDAGTLPVLAAGIAGSWLIVGVVALAVAVSRAEPGPSAPSLPSTTRLVRFGARSVLGSASPSDGAGVDQAVVGLFLSTRALGLYVVAAAFMNLSRLVTQSIGLVAYPDVAGRTDARDATRAMWRFTAIGVAAALVITVALELTVDGLIAFFFGQSFAAADGVARILLVAAFLAGARRVLSDAARGADRPLAGTLAEIASWAVLVPAMIVLTPLLGRYGVALALVVASAASLLVIVRQVRRPPRSPAAPPTPETPAPPGVAGVG